ncbi:MAG TPA: TonB-dependent receptor plug domain-containing protein, partial [Rhodothermales bacterium]|nr:TonB-dependent receptor plug domain-containing protein [Rhodothermales bacterium]
MFKRARCFLSLVLWPALALGQAAPDTTVALPDVTVTATRLPTSTARAPVRVTVLDGEAIQATAASSAADLLEARSSLFVKRYGASGLASLSLRGSSPAQTLVLLDGHRIADPQLGELDLSLLPTILMQSIEVVRGASSALYGTDGMGGVVNVRTVAPADAPQVRVLGGLGAYGARNGSVLFSQREGRFSGLALVDYDGTEGNFPYLNHGFLPPREVRRTGADRTRRSLLSSLGYTGPRNEVQAA